MQDWKMHDWKMQDRSCYPNSDLHCHCPVHVLWKKWFKHVFTGLGIL